MILPWKNKRKKYPDFWLKYLETFNSEQPKDINKTSFVIFDTETTGFDFKQDRILCIGALKLQGAAIVVSSIFEKYIHQEYFNPDTVHIHGILKNEVDHVLEKEAIISFLNYIGNSVIIGHHVNFDVTMVNHSLIRLGLPKLKNKVLDTGILYKKTRINSHFIEQEKIFSLDELADLMHLSKKDRHTALGDAYITAIVFLKILSKLKKGHKLTLKHLFKLMKY